MPFYHAIVRPEVLAPADREALSNDVTSVHCDVTGAPRTFVHVLYTVDDANRLPDNIDVLFRANIRSGRTQEQKSELAARLQIATAERTSASAPRVAIHIEETEASFVMEGGSLLPEPGSPEEEAWKALDA
ncbi:MAG: hypothetical protein CL447_06620 [Acidimicrobiaceae bacterium]|nr:hypothetical protein [Acidimicrobiaceae bacterium]